MDMSNVLAAFDKIGVGSREATETTNKAVATAGRYGGHSITIFTKGYG